MAGTWRGILGTVKVSFGTTGATEEFIRLLPEGIGVVITYAAVTEHSLEGFREAFDGYDRKVAKLAQLGVCDLIQPEGWAHARAPGPRSRFRPRSRRGPAAAR